MRPIRKYLLIILICIAGVAMCQNLWAQGFPKSLGGSPFGDANQLRYIPSDDIYSTNFLRDSSYIFSAADTDSLNWVLTDKYLYRYDNQGREVESIYAVSPKPGVWNNKLRLKNYYDADQFLSFQKEYNWNPDSLQWNPSLRRIYAYNLVGLKDIIYTEQWLDIEWHLRSKVEYDYNASYDISEERNFVRDTANNSWEPVSRYFYTYINGEQLTQEVYQLWVDSLNTWVNSTVQKYDYNQNQLVSTTKSNWSAEKGDWIDTSIISLSYNAEGKVDTTRQMLYAPDTGYSIPVQAQEANYNINGNVDQVLNSHWNSELQSWEVYQKKIHFWSKYVNGNLNETTDNIRCVFSNPYIIGLPWYCESLKPSVLYTVEVFDTFGRQFYSDQFQGRSTFRISKPIPPGMYIVVIRGGLDYHTEKVLIRN